jgi:CubicO group peptidase (beta-lactamase class C family)
VDTAAIDRLLEPYDGADRPGASVLVMRGAEVVFRQSRGMADLEEPAPATPQTSYRLASVTKAFTAAAILKLGIPVATPVRRFLPSLPLEADGVTVDHLLTHTSGLIDYEDVIPEGTTEQLLDADVLRLLESQHRLYFPPGTSYRYSNSGYALLALIAERASGKSFEEVLRETIFKPLGMKGTVLTGAKNRAYGYSREGNRWIRTDQSLTSAVRGDGGIYSSIDDMAAWMAALDRGEFAEGSIPRVDTDNPGTRYGYGWRITGGTVHHTGETIGFRNAVFRVPAERLAVVVLTNRNEMGSELRFLVSPPGVEKGKSEALTPSTG